MLLLFLGLNLAPAEPTAAQLVGHCRYEAGDKSYDYYFHEDGTFIGNVAQKEQIPMVIGGN